MRRCFVQTTIVTLLLTVVAAPDDAHARVRLPVSETTVISPAASTATQTLVYDSGPWYYNPLDDFAGAQWACRFTPPAACSLLAVEIATYSGDFGWRTGSLEVAVHADIGGTPGGRIAGPFYLLPTGDLSLQLVTFPAPIDVGTADFHIIICLPSDNAAHPTFDGDGGTGRTWYRSDSVSAWQVVTNQDVVLRAHVATYAGDHSGPDIVHTPISRAFAYDGVAKVVACITDESTVSADLHHSTDGVNYTTTPMTAADSVYTANITSLVAGMTVWYYITARDGSAQANVSSWPAGGVASPRTFTVLPGMELKNDDGLAEAYYIQSEIFDGNAFAVLFTPYLYPARVTHLRVHVEDTAAFSLAIHTASTGQPGDVMYGPVVVRGDTGPGWAEVPIPEYLQPEISVGHFFVVLRWMFNSPTLPRVGTDLSGSVGRSFWGSNSFGWNSFSAGEFIIRAAVTVPTSVLDDATTTVPTTIELAPNRPNPFNAATVIEFRTKLPGRAALEVRDILGRHVRTLIDGFLEAGAHEAVWDGTDRHDRPIASGVYFYTLATSSETKSRKMVLMK